MLTWTTITSDFIVDESPHTCYGEDMGHFLSSSNRSVAPDYQGMSATLEVKNSSHCTVQVLERVTISELCLDLAG